MCTVSMIGDFYSYKWPTEYPWVIPAISSPPGTATQGSTSMSYGVSREEFEQLKREVQDLKALLVRAKEYDEKNGEPKCEMEEKVNLLKKVAELVGVDIGL